MNVSVLIKFSLKTMAFIGDKKFSVFTAGSIFWQISRVMGVINEFGFRWFASFTDAVAARKKSEKSATKGFPFLLLAAYFGKYLGSWV